MNQLFGVTLEVDVQVLLNHLGTLPSSIAFVMESGIFSAHNSCNKWVCASGIWKVCVSASYPRLMYAVADPVEPMSSFLNYAKIFPK